MSRTWPGIQRPDRTDPMPLWAQVHADLRARIMTGDFAAGFPGELSLTEAYDVSRHTIREAMRVLTNEGLIRRERGRGTTLTPPRFEQDLNTLYSLFDSMKAQGVDHHSQVRRLARTVNGVVAENLGLPVDTELIVLERVRYAASEPLAVDTSWLPAEPAAALLGVDFQEAGLYAQLHDLCGVTVDAGTEKVTAINAPSHIAEQLHVAEHTALLMMERFALAQQHPIEWRETYIRADRFSLESTWTPARSPITA
ncbi:MAG: GntR family transcriptional regulator [Candidatus Nanopelagicales bacterium]|jgi:GntR family transcriptional regulator|nr:GntR family transcriptional regulator [Candidatus Nanopelagicales bacterium]MDP4825441.1 GntR family transcriptional regulator [Candidatus Nanopelagicales bacterium]MDP4887947.1 GntR family transcriptional regulator [Candidatus Nanopelagicales bacterium]